MTREQLEHVVRAAGAITDERQIFVLGSQSILGSFPQPPALLAVSREADVCPVHDRSKVDMISGAIGEISQFDSTFGYYAHGLPPESCPLPVGWETRLVRLQNENTRGVTGLCLAPVDLAASKLAAGRDKDKEFVEEMLRHRLIQASSLEAQIMLLPVAEQREFARSNLQIVCSRILAVGASDEVAEDVDEDYQLRNQINNGPDADGPRMQV